MVEKKLNFNQPILSVRRYTPKMASQIADGRKGNNAFPIIRWLPPHKPEPNSGPVRNPGAVPFHWEQIPGRPKEGVLARADQPQYSHQVASTTSSDNEMEAEAVVDGVDLGLESASTTSEMSEYAAAKRQLQEEEKRGKVVYQDKPVLVHCRPSFESSFFHYNKKKECGDGQVQPENVITVCCLLPRSCLKSSVCNLNPVPVTSLMNRVMTFPASRILLSGSSLSSSSTDSENEVMKEAEAVTKHGPCKKSFKTLQELLADDGCTVKKMEIDNEFGDDSESNVKTTSDEMNMMKDSSSEEEDEEDIHIRIAVNKAANNAKKQLLRARTLGNGQNLGVVPPPLPESPSDSWLFRTLPSVSAKKATSSTFISRFSNASTHESYKGFNVERLCRNC